MTNDKELKEKPKDMVLQVQNITTSYISKIVRPEEQDGRKIST